MAFCRVKNTHIALRCEKQRDRLFQAANKPNIVRTRIENDHRIGNDTAFLEPKTCTIERKNMRSRCLPIADILDIVGNEHPAYRLSGLQPQDVTRLVPGRNGLGVTRWPGSFPHRIAFHTSCHSRGTQSGVAALTLLRSIPGCEVLEFGDAEQCCGFGGAFSVTFPNISAEMGRLKLEHAMEPHPEFLVSSDMGCLLHLGGLVSRGEKPVKCMHLVEVLRASLAAK